MGSGESQPGTDATEENSGNYWDTHSNRASQMPMAHGPHSSPERLVGHLEWQVWRCGEGWGVVLSAWPTAGGPPTIRPIRPMFSAQGHPHPSCKSSVLAKGCSV